MPFNFLKRIKSPVVFIALIVFQIAVRLLPLTHLEESMAEKREQIAPDKGVGADATNA